MNVQELYARFPEIPADLQDEPVMAEFAEQCGELLAVAHKPSNCSTEHDAGNHFYLKLISPLAIYGYGLATRDKVLGQIRDLVAHRRADPENFPASLLPANTADREVKGPGCE